ncbi:MAG TPA: helix-turn-helix domain-containing protein [Chitinophagaceae bacterium]|nr:helix-turn-helix domain-containing protein [Chitinophagaceae bacterium]
MTATLAFIGGRWKTIILYTLSPGTRRFGELAVRIPAISRKVLTQQLKELENHGLVKRVQFNEIPPRVEYSITELGSSLSKVLKEMENWGIEKGVGLLKEK